MSTAAAEENPATTVLLAESLTERLAQRGSQPLGVIDVRQPQQHYARTAGWLSRRFPLLQELAARYQGDEEVSAGAAAVYRTAPPSLAVAPIIATGHTIAAAAGSFAPVAGAAASAPAGHPAPAAAGMVAAASAPTDRPAPMAVGVTADPVAASPAALPVATAWRAVPDSPATLWRQSLDHVDPAARYQPGSAAAPAGDLDRVDPAAPAAELAPPAVTLRVRRQAVRPAARSSSALLPETAVAPGRSNDAALPDQPDALPLAPSSSSEQPTAPQPQRESDGRSPAPSSSSEQPTAPQPQRESDGRSPVLASSSEQPTAPQPQRESDGRSPALASSSEQLIAQQFLSTRPAAPAGVAIAVRPPWPVLSHSVRSIPAEASAPVLFRKASGVAGATRSDGSHPLAVEVMREEVADGVSLATAPAQPVPASPVRAGGAGFQPTDQSRPAPASLERTPHQSQALHFAPFPSSEAPTAQQRLLARPAAPRVVSVVPAASPPASPSGRSIPASGDAPALFRKASSAASPVSSGASPAPVVEEVTAPGGARLAVAPAAAARPLSDGTSNLIWRKSSAPAAIPVTANPGTVEAARTTQPVSHQVEAGGTFTEIMLARETTVSRVETGQQPLASWPGEAASTAALDWEQLFAQFSRRLLRQLAIERERRGGKGWS